MSNFSRRSITTLYTLCLVLLINTAALHAAHAADELKGVTLDSATGIAMFNSSDNKNDYIQLSRYFVTQITPSYCGVASSTMILNALDANAPDIFSEFDFTLFNQENIFDHISKNIVTAAQVQKQGMTLDTLGALLGSFPVQVKVVHADQSSLDQFRHDAINALQNQNQYILINFQREPIYGVRVGHITPLGAYDQDTDSFLIMDVARYSFPPLWVKTADLWDAIHTQDPSISTAAYRGYVIVSKEDRA